MGGVRVWLNPPYSRPLIERFVEKMVRNNNGIALLFNRCDSKMFQDLIFPNASAIMFVKGRIKFYRPDGTQGDSPGCGSVLIAFGEENAKILEYSKCKSFPVTHSKAGEATDFEKKLKDKSKIHTIRYNAKNVWNGRYKDIVSGKKYLSIREWTGRPYNSEQKEIAQLPKIGLQHVTMTYSSEDAYPEIWIDNKKVSIHEVAKNDGLSVEDFVEWFFGNNKENVFEGVVIHFTDFRY